MADTCIVCLGDFQIGDVPTDAPASKSPVSVTAGAAPELLAHLLPCGHHLHDECLKPWVERCNSCPICRATFNVVENVLTIGGPVISSYAVQDKRQVAEIDPALVIEEDIFDEVGSHEDPCIVCETFGDESELLCCDGCNNTTHVFCAGLENIPADAWFCSTCQEDPRVLGGSYRAAPNNRLLVRPQNAPQTRRRGRELGWERVWRSVFHQLNFDLEFPFDEEEDISEQQRVQAERREFQQWQRRFNVAARSGAATRFRNTATLLQTRAPQRPDPESQEEIRAWNAFEKARMLQEEPRGQPRNTDNRRKRKSPSGSPREKTPPPTERKLKRPRISRRQQALAEAPASVGESSRASARRIAVPDVPDVPAVPAAPTPERSRQPSRSSARGVPTFLQSLLSEVESHPAPSGSDSDAFNDCSDSGSGPERSPSPRNASMHASPVASNHPSPRAMTPQPHSPITRPASPPPLASSITPVFPPAPEFSPFSPAEDSVERARSRIPKQASRQTAPLRTFTQPNSSSRDQSPNHSPTRPPVSYEMKTEIAKMVSGVLKPHYYRKEIDKDKFTEINRDISRMMYEKVWDAGGLIDQATRDRWQKVAVEEVAKAVRNSMTTKETSRRPDSSLAQTSEVTIRPATVSA